ncbi:MAG: enoyl-CoA hydratase/isomerase family protein [Anaerolineales bacterium]|nr:enoyl-CoA hydratase/isomerase family protein [Anaerolineales bacterium]MCB9004142.1 enoyl-CoA hydratase/isomerase family protein [Ardenticatenaceae bacterium]
MTDGIHFHVDDNGLAVLQVQRPQARNALNWAAQEAFATAVSTAARTPHIRVLLITGDGDKAFVAGGDLIELGAHPESEAGARLNRIMGTALARLTELPIPVIAAANGDAFGGGCEILTACDLRLAAAHARFSFAQVKVGLTTGWGGAGRLVRLIGQSRAMELLLTGRLIDAAEAHRLGLVHRVVPAGESVQDAARAWAEELITLPRHALASMKALVHVASHSTLVETYWQETKLFTQLWASPDHLEALNAFREKRPSRFNQ